MEDRADDDLLQPSLRRGQGGWRPDEEVWRPGSMVYVAFFGGVLAATVLTAVNARRFGLPPGARRRIVVMGVVGLVVTAAAVALLPVDDRGVRLVSRAVAVVAHLVMVREFRTVERLHEHQDGGYLSLWGPGVGASLAFGLVTAVVLGAISGTVGA